MGCNCGSRASAARVASRSGALPAGFDQSRPILIGEVDDVLRRVRVIIPVEGLSIGSSVWVTGDDIQQHIETGALLDITSVAQRQRMWRVGGFTYTSYQEASRVAASLGTTPIEVA